MGHITLLANEVDKASELYDDVKEAVTGDEVGVRFDIVIVIFYLYDMIVILHIMHISYQYCIVSNIYLNVCMCVCFLLTQQEWTAYTETHLKQMNHLLSTPLGRPPPPCNNNP